MGTRSHLQLLNLLLLRSLLSHRMKSTLRRNLMPSLLDEAIKVGKDLEGAGKQLETIEAQIESAQHRLKDALAEAESQSRTIVQSAKDEAALLVKSAEQTQKQALQKLQEVEAREKAVEWVKEEDAKLKKRTQTM